MKSMRMMLALCCVLLAASACNDPSSVTSPSNQNEPRPDVVPEDTTGRGGGWGGSGHQVSPPNADSLAISGGGWAGSGH